MKKNLAKKVTLSILAGAALMSSSVVWAAAPTGWTEDGVIYVRNSDNVNGIVPGGPSVVYESKDFTGKYGKNIDVNGGIVTIDGGTFNGHIYGGWLNETNSGTCSNNKVIIKSGNFNTKKPSGTIIAGGYVSNGGNANNNMVVITGFNGMGECYVHPNTYKGLHYIAGGYAGVGSTANGNKVIISGGTFEQGTLSYSESQYIIGGWGNEQAKDNIVTITGNTKIKDLHLWGGRAKNGIVSNNTLNIGINEILLDALDPVDNDGKREYGLQVGAWSGEGTGKVKSIQGFDVINFAYVNWEKNGTVVEVGSLSLNNTEIKVGTVNVAGGTTLANGDKMALISVTANGTMTGNISNTENVAVCQGIADVYKGYVSQNTTDKKIYLKLGDGPAEGHIVPPPSGTTPGGGTSGGSTSGGGTPQPERNDQVLVLGESRAAAVAFTNQGSELIETGLDALARDNSKDTKVFAAVYGNHSEYETGSHVNVNGWSGIVGIGKTNANGLTVGAFFENGEGNYSTHNIFTADYIRGDGEACYNGGGLLVRKDNANGVYAEASLRAGNLQNELRNAVRNGSELTGYDIDTFYYGAHVGVGKVIARGIDGDSIDVYGKFIYTHHDGETFDIGGTATKFDSVESERLRLGFRINEVQTNKLAMYYGAAWEYEFNGDAHDKIASFDLETPSLEGSTVIGEIGAHYKASEKWSIDLNGRAYVGQREGFSGSVQANYSF